MTKHHQHFSKEEFLLRQLAELHDIQTSYEDNNQNQINASSDTLVALLKEFGIPIKDNLKNAGELLKDRTYELNQNIFLSAQIISRKNNSLTFQAGNLKKHHTVDIHIKCEDGERIRWTHNLSKNNQRIPIPTSIPFGYHKLQLSTPGELHETLLISHPSATHQVNSCKHWGFFIPLYSLKRQNNWGIGDFQDLCELAKWQQQFDATLIGSLPLLATHLDKHHFNPSPYAPMSRLFWNEIFLTINLIDDIKTTPSALDILNNSDFQNAISQCQKSKIVNYRDVYLLKRRILEVLSKDFFQTEKATHHSFQDFLSHHPELEDYATFRSHQELQSKPWWQWDPNLSMDNKNFQDRKNYHLYVQFQCFLQLNTIKKEINSCKNLLYLDYPLGVSRNSYDVFHNQKQFLLNTSVGAPPDSFFQNGQNWGFSPLHPHAFSKEFPQYFKRSLAHHMKHSDILRLDHIMSLNRLYCIPDGMSAKEGAYLRYPADTMYAIVCLESHRQQCVVVGEDLGTVPFEVKEKMDEHSISHLYVLQYEVSPTKPLQKPSQNSLSCLNTHDMPPFQAFYDGSDIELREHLGHLFHTSIHQEQRKRNQTHQNLIRSLTKCHCLKTTTPDSQELFLACLQFLARQNNSLTLLNLEDLWQENQPQNVPGTTDEYPNWQRKAKYSLETIQKHPEIMRTLQTIQRYFKEKSCF